MIKKMIRIYEADNVGIAVEGAREGDNLVDDQVNCVATMDIPVNHKIALQDFEEGDIIYKYGNKIGVATQKIKKGDWVHSHNMETGLSGMLEYNYHPTEKNISITAPKRNTFLGYVRENGKVGTRNEIWVIPTVSCVNHTTQIIVEKAREKFGHLCDGIYAFPHNAGCSQLGTDHQVTQRILASIMKHPNAGGALIVSLGCENNNLKEFRPVLGEVNENRVKFMIAQEEGNEIEAGIQKIGEIAKYISKDKREEMPVSKLRIGFKCGGSDALSGVTANPLCGKISEMVTAEGGIAILTEVPEMFGAETILMNRSDSEETFGKVVNLINDFKQYYMDYNQPIYENPAPGNKAGGITTLEEKSLGCIQKGGHCTVTDTLMYGENAHKAGLNLMNGPGNDSVSITNLVAAGAQIILFTTGRGNPLGTAVPAIKIASNTDLYRRKKHWFDFNAGTLLEGSTMESLSEEMWNKILDVCSGNLETQNEIFGYKDIMIFKNGVLL